MAGKKNGFLPGRVSANNGLPQHPVFQPATELQNISKLFSSNAGDPEAALLNPLDKIKCREKIQRLPKRTDPDAVQLF